MLTRSCVSRTSKIRIFRTTKCKQWGHKKLGTLKPLVLRLSKNLILKFPKCRPIAHTTFTLGRNNIFRPPKCIKWTTKKYVPLNLRFHDSPKIEIIRLPKCRKCAHTNLGMLEPRVSRFGRNQETRAHKKLQSLEPWVTQLGRNGVFRPPKYRKWAHKSRYLSTVVFTNRLR